MRTEFALCVRVYSNLSSCVWISWQLKRLLRLPSTTVKTTPAKCLVEASTEQVDLAEFVSNWNMLINNEIQGDMIEFFHSLK